VAEFILRLVTKTEDVDMCAIQYALSEAFDDDIEVYRQVPVYDGNRRLMGFQDAKLG
jgi:hypothetical protein